VHDLGIWLIKFLERHLYDKVKGIIEAKVAAIIEICCNAVTPKVVK